MSTPPKPIDGLCMEQACRGVLFDLRYTVEQWAEHYAVPTEAPRAMLVDAFLFERAGWIRLSPEFFAELANDIIAERGNDPSERGAE